MDCAASSEDADGPSAVCTAGGTGFSLSPFWPRQIVQKSMTEKAAETNPLRRNRQHFQGVYFFSN
jgi:hypothetical protein